MKLYLIYFRINEMALRAPLIIYAVVMVWVTKVVNQKHILLQAARCT